MAMKTLLRWCLVFQLAGGLAGFSALADEANRGEAARVDQPASVGVLDNLYLNAGAGIENSSGEDSTFFGSVGADWGIPLTPPEGVAFGLQVGGSVKARDDDPELNATFGGFGRNFRTFQDQQGAVGLLFDYQRTAFHNNIWDFRPIIGTTISPRDALGLEGVAGLNTDNGQEMTSEFTFFWTRDWTDTISSELGWGYQFSDVDEVLFRGRVAFGLSPNVDIGVGGDVNGDGDYALGAFVSYHFGGTGRHAALHNIGGSGAALYTPFPDANFPDLEHRTR
jgi:hypothetical protein